MYEEYLRFKEFEDDEEEQLLLREKKGKVNRGMYYIYNDVELEEEQEEEIYY